MSKLHAALGGMTRIPQWFVWRLEWMPAEQKYHKQPARPDGLIYPISAKEPANWMTYEQALLTQATLRSAGTGFEYALGFYLTADCGYWFLDIDGCVNGDQFSDIAKLLYGAFPGAAGEYSSSARGLHIFGRGTVPPHNTRPPKPKDGTPPLPLEFYTQERGIAFGLNDAAWGTIDLDWTPQLEWLVANYFPPGTAYEDEALVDGGPVASWDGPTDDDELIAMALRSRNAKAAFGAGVSFADLWNRNLDTLHRFYGVDGESEWEAALIAHLSFWTGRDIERIERIMRYKGAIHWREKWDSNRQGETLLRYSIRRIVEKGGDVYSKPKPATSTPSPYALTAQVTDAGAAMTLTPQVAGENVPREVMQRVDELVDLIGRCGTVADIHNLAVPAIQASGIPSALRGRIERVLTKALDMLESPIRAGELRALLWPPEVREAEGVPEFMQAYVYVLSEDSFFNLYKGTEYSRAGFNAQYNRFMPIRDNGARMDASVMALDRWDMRCVDTSMYMPGEQVVFSMGGKSYANLYNELSLPPMPEQFSHGGVAAIERFRLHLWHLVGGRQWLFDHLIYFMAHNVQRPGVKIRHCPLIKGIEGDGKTIIGNVMRAVMGMQNVREVPPSEICNPQFNAWAHGAALNVVNELMMVGKARYATFNGIKPMITDGWINVTGKGKDGKTVVNNTNYIAMTNFVDAIPLTVGDRRWLVIFTPWVHVEDFAQAVCGSTSLQALEAHFKVIFDSLKREPGEWRKWLLSVAIPDAWSADSRAPITEERGEMILSGMDDYEVVARAIVEDGGRGVTKDVLSSGCLSKILNARANVEGFEVPKTTSLSHMLSRMGFSQLTERVKWGGMTHRIWATRNFKERRVDVIREILEATT